MVQKQHIERQAQRPSLFKYIAEFIRFWIELLKAFIFRKRYEVTTQGDSHPVLVIPGFMANDLTTSPLREFIKKLGYSPYPWDLRRNYGDISQLNILEKKIEELYAKHQTKVSLIGWSLGGVYARQLAKEKPHLIRQIITMGAPFAGIHQPNNAAPLYNLINVHKPIAVGDKKWLVDLLSPAPVPTTAIYSKQDGIVPWQVCMEQKEDDTHQNIEIKGGHFGLVRNPSVWLIVEDRLQYTAETWIQAL